MRVWTYAAMAAVAMAGMPAHAAGPSLMVSLTSNDRVGFDVSRPAKSATVSAAVGMWSDDGALELGGFRDGQPQGIDPAAAKAAELVSGKPMRSQGVRLGGTLYRHRPDARGWSLSLEARRQQVTDVGAALSGNWRTSGDSRLSVGGKLRF